MATATAEKLEVKRSVAVALFLTLGFKTADKWADPLLISKLKKLPETVDDEDNEVEDEDQKALLEEVLAADGDTKIVLVGDAKSGGKPGKPAPKTPAKKPGKAKPAEDEEEEEEESEEEEEADEDEVPVASGKKKGPKKGTPPPKRAEGAGVIGSILEFIKAASPEKPINKEKILEKLTKRFPDRDADGMKKTIQAQVPNRLANDKKVKIVKTDKGFYVK